MKCKYCNRESPYNIKLTEKGIKWFTENGCIWCDIEYHYNVRVKGWENEKKTKEKNN